MSAPLPTARILRAMEALRDPFSRVHPMFWPVLWLSLRAFVRWTRRMIEDGHGYGGLSVEITWYGWIHVTAVDLSEAGKDFRRHMMGKACEDGWGVLAKSAERVQTLIAQETADPCAGRGPWTILATLAPGSDSEPWIPACAGIGGDKRRARKGTCPPLPTAPLPHAGRGAIPEPQVTPESPPRAGARAGAGASTARHLPERTVRLSLWTAGPGPMNARPRPMTSRGRPAKPFSLRCIRRNG